jgi:calcium-dependent protein kinase
MLIVRTDGADHLILSNCTISKRDVTYKESKVDGLALSSTAGSTFLFFAEEVEQRTWYKQLKLYCKLSGFLSKYKLAEKMHPGLYQCVKRKVELQVRWLEQSRVHSADLQDR